jgi:2-oxoglutarate dehydrogenase E2 component (dihydrolipoamide succinyltransferase)
MLVEVKVPQLSESVSEATLLAWHKKPGEYVQRDENLIDIETDKVVLELPAPEAGLLTKIVKGDGGTVVSNEVIATIDTDAKGPTAGKGAAATAPIPAATIPAPAAKDAVPKPQPKAAEPIALPAARKLAAESKVDLSVVQGTGRGGRVTKEDVVNKLAEPTGGPGAKSPAPTSVPVPTSPRVDVPEVLGDRPEQRVPMSRLRQRVAERLVQSQSTAAILTTFNEVNMQPVMELRKKYQEKFEKEHGVRLGFMSFFVKASVQALKKYPVVNASVDGTDIVYHGYYDIGIAVASPRGLVVPIVRNADQLSLAEIEKTIDDYGKRAQEGKLGIQELTGGAASPSQRRGVRLHALDAHHQSAAGAILGIHATKGSAGGGERQIVIRPMNYLALSYDHRIIDGREAVLSLVAMKDALEDPARMLLDL